MPSRINVMFGSFKRYLIMGDHPWAKFLQNWDVDWDAELGEPPIGDTLLYCKDIEESCVSLCQRSQRWKKMSQDRDLHKNVRLPSEQERFKEMIYMIKSWGLL